MNKILKRLVGLFIIGIGILNMCNADNVFNTIVSAQNIYAVNGANLNNSSYVNLFNYNSPNTYGDMRTGAGTYCINITSTSPQTLDMGFANGPTTAPSNLYKLYNDQYGNRICLYGNKPYLNAKLNSSSNSVNIIVYNLEQLLETEIQNNFTLNYDYGDGTLTGFMQFTGNIGNIALITPDTETYKITKQQNLLGYDYILKIRTNFDLNMCSDNGYILESSINTAYCTGHNLCPACEECQQCQTCPTIDAQYCMNNFNLIPPAYCPICGTGDVNRSSLYINGTQYNSNEMIDIHTENQMDIDIDYLNDTVDIDITYGQDETYLNNILSGTAMTPTKEDFSTMLSDGLIAYAPYLFIGLLMIFTIGLIKKFFRG